MKNYYSKTELNKFNFKKIGKNVLISRRASIIDPKNIIIGDNSRIDDFSLLYGNIYIGKNVHITPMCLVGAGKTKITISDFCTLSYGVKVFSQSDDYIDGYMTGSTISSELKKDIKKPVVLEKYVILGANSVVFPGCRLSEGTSVGAMSLILKNTKEWSLYFGVPAKYIKKRKKILLRKIISK